MRALVRFLRQRPLLWIVPLVVFLALLFVAWKVGRTPDSPYIYRL